jgi:predicted phosphodiesterase
MRYAIFSDIHDHAQALTSILRHASQQQVDKYFCLGDMGGIGADGCVTEIREMDITTVFGNWEVFTWHHYSPENQAWVLKLAPVHKEPHFWLTHATPLWRENVATLADLNEERFNRAPITRLFPYLHQDTAALWRTMSALKDANIPLLFHGHTHCQIAWRFTHNNHLKKLTNRAITLSPDETFIIGVGSVGRPEDNSKPSYTIYDEESGVIEMIRV